MQLGIFFFITKVHIDNAGYLFMSLALGLSAIIHIFWGNLVCATSPDKNPWTVAPKTGRQADTFT
jgi:hypothetical protein